MGLPALSKERHADMPFAEHRRRVTFAAQQGGQRQARFFNHARPARTPVNTPRIPVRNAIRPVSRL